MLKGDQYQDKDNVAWRNAELPALRGSHSNSPWAQVLRALIHEGVEV